MNQSQRYAPREGMELEFEHMARHGHRKEPHEKAACACRGGDINTRGNTRECGQLGVADATAHDAEHIQLTI